MERIFAIIVSIIFSILNNTPLRVSEPPMFSEAGIYRFADEDGYTTQELNSKQSGTSGTLSSSPEAASATKQAGLYSPIAGRQLTDDELSKTILTWTDDDISNDKTVVMPESATVGDDSSGGNGGHDLTLKSGHYTFKFANMQCRYCDMNREPQAVWTDTADLTGKSIPAGNTVGVAKEGTTLKIYKDGKAIKLSEYYSK